MCTMLFLIYLRTFSGAPSPHWYNCPQLDPLRPILSAFTKRFLNSSGIWSFPTTCAMVLLKKNQWLKLNSSDARRRHNDTSCSMKTRSVQCSLNYRNAIRKTNDGKNYKESKSIFVPTHFSNLNVFFSFAFYK